ncbi:response regulator [Desulfovibrio sp. OttesenSCG-928-O18]|nr:response regulator [Desulfovibrio sp. OttesenSCG-928-O18]
MKQFLTANITRTAICVVLLSVLPALAIIAATGVERYSDEIEAAQARGERFVRTIAVRQNQVAEVMETLAQVLVRLRDVREGDAVAASSLFRDLVANSPEYNNIVLLDNDGSVIASALPVPSGLNFSRYTFFKRALRRNAFSVGKVVDSPFSKEPVLYFAMPAMIKGRDNPGVISVALNLARYDETLAGLVLPKGAVVYFLDGTGALASAYPKPGPVPPGDILGGEIWRSVQNASEGAGHFLAGEVGAPASLQVAFRKLFLPGMDQPYFYILYVRPENLAYARAKSLQSRDMTIFAVVAFLSMAAALGLCWYTVRRPWRRLLVAAAGVASGDLSTRVGEKGVSGEIGTLNREFNAMAQALDRRDKELSAARDYAELSRNAKSEFLANMSHEIRTSMNAILGMAYLVLKTELTAQQKGYVSKLLAAANALLRVINDILDFSKMEAGKLTMERIGFSLRRIMSTVRSESSARLGEKKLGFDLSIGLGVPDHLLGDPLRLSQALMIMVDDAVSRSERGKVSLGCSVRSQGEEEVTLDFAVHDAGVGLTPVQLAEMRELFERDESDPPATMDKMKLRLAICNRLFRMMGGGITVSSVFGEGVLFTASARFGFAATEFRQPDRLFEGQKALIVDSSEVSRQDLVEILPRFGFAVECVPDLEAARNLLRKAEADNAPVSVAFVDWRSSSPDTPALVTELKAAPGILAPPPVILTTAVGRAELPASLEELDIDALLPKPINESLVFDTLMNVLGASRAGQDDLEGSAPEQEPGGFAGVRVLLAEDNLVNQQIAAEIMESEGMTLVVAVDGEEAVAILSENIPGAFDLVLMDLQMPKMDGFAATRALRSQKAFHPLRLPVIAMTAHSDINEISACFAAGMNDHTGKPIIVDKFFATLRRWLPVRADDAENIVAAVAHIRELVNKADPESLARLDETLDALVPVLHEGRVDMIRAILRDGEPQAIGDALEALTAMAHSFLFPEEEP